MKKIFYTVFALACVIALALTFTACSSTCASHSDIDKNGYCDICNTPYTCPGHKDVNADKLCDFCLADYSHQAHYDENQDMACDVCGVTFICAHEDADADELCDLCFGVFVCPKHSDANGDGICDDCLGPYSCTEHKDKKGKGVCDICNAKFICQHMDADEDGSCDVCTAPFLCDGHIDAGSDGKCDKCYAPFICSEHTDDNGDSKCDICQAHYVEAPDYRKEFNDAVKATNPDKMVVKVITKYSDDLSLVSEYIITYNDDGSFVIVAKLQRLGGLDEDVVVQLPDVTISCDNEGVYSDGGDFIAANPSASKPMIDFTKIKSGKFSTPNSSVLEATVSAADTKDVLGVKYDYPVTIIANKSATEITSLVISYSNVTVICNYNAD